MKFKVASVQGGSLFQEGILMTSTQKAPKKANGFLEDNFCLQENHLAPFWVVEQLFF